MTPVIDRVTVARVLRALGRDDRVDLPDFSIRALLAGGEIAELAGIAPGRSWGA